MTITTVRRLELPPSVEIHLNLDTLEARHCLTTDPLRYHSGFSEADRDAGWKQMSAVSAKDVTEVEIEAMKAAAIASNRAFWLDLTAEHKDDGIIAGGYHYVAQALSVGQGVEGEAFRVDWLDASRPPLVCNLQTQGEIPGWLRPNHPDNATVTKVGSPGA